jgi:hypothetical protein
MQHSYSQGIYYGDEYLSTSTHSEQLDIAVTINTTRLVAGLIVTGNGRAYFQNEAMQRLNILTQKLDVTPKEINIGNW